jgi:hypothetical protein
VANRPIYVVLGVTVDGERDILGLWAGDGGEGAKYWLHVLTEVKNRGTQDVCGEARQPAAPCAAPDGIRAYPHVPLAAQIVVTAPSYDHPVLHDTFGAECARCGCRVAPRRNGPAPTGGV